MEAKRNPKDSMKSTWRTADKSTWGFFHWFYEFLGIHPSYLDRKPPVHQKTDKVPFVSEWQSHRFILFYGLIPVALHQLYISYFGKNMHWSAAFYFYSTALKLIAIKELKMLRGLGYKHGFLDGDKHERDEVPDGAVKKVFMSLLSTANLRPAMAVLLTYRASVTPSSINWLLLPVEIGLYGIVLDFWFYWYHRVMHQYDGLWKYHRTHHLTKHPNPLLTLYADNEQEIFDILGIPLLTYFSLKAMGLPMGFYEFWICQQYTIFTELIGHSGLRIHYTPPNPFTPIMRKFQADLCIEDHDLHHRMGWKKSHNYGKQTRIWDRVFGTCHDRIEEIDNNIDYVNTVKMPLF